MVPDLAITAKLVRQDLRTQRPWVAVFDSPEGAAVLEYRTPRTMRRGNPLFAEHPKLLLWQPGTPRRVLADVDLSASDPETIEPALKEVVARGRDHAAGERDLFDLLLSLVRAHHLGTTSRATVPTVGSEITEAGSPSPGVWASCLTLADIQQAMLATAI